MPALEELVENTSMLGNLPKEGIEKLVDQWLNSVTSSPSGHMLVMNMMNLSEGPTRFGTPTFPSQTGYSDSVTKLFNKITQLLMEPNIDGIPIHTSKESVSRKIDVSEQRLLRQMGENEDEKAPYQLYFTNNAVPKPKEWTLTGYLTSNPLIDGWFYLKISLLTQIEILDGYSVSRRPVWYKGHDNQFHKVQVTSFDYTWDPTATNAVAVTIQMKEFNPLIIRSNHTVTTTLGLDSTASSSSEAASQSETLTQEALNG